MLRKYPRLMLLTLLLLLALPFVIAPGCGGGGGGGPAPDTNEVTLSDDAVVIPNDGTVVVEGQTADEVVLSGDVPPLSPGDILVSTIDEGFLRKVESVNVSAADVGPAQVQIQTSPATLEEAIEDADIQFSQALGAEDFTSVEPLIEGVVVPQVGPAVSPSTGPLSVDINATLLDQGGSTVTLTGSISFTPTVIFNLDVSGFYLNSLESALRVDMQSDLTLDAQVTGSLQKEVPLAQFYGAPIPIPPTPIILVPKLTVVVGLEGEVMVGIETGFEFEGWAKAGLAYADGSWTPITGVGHSFTFYPPSFYIEANTKVYGGLKESLLIMGIAGPYVYQHAYGEVIAELNPLESLLVGDAWMGLEAGAGVHVDIFGWELADYELPYVLDIVPRMKPPSCPNNCHWEADMSAPSVNLSSDDAEIELGDSTTLHWTSTNATAVVESNFDAEAIGVSGDKEVSPSSTIDYYITVGGPGGQASDHATVIVSVPDDPPTVQITWPSNGYTTDNSPITVQGTASDDNQVSLVQVRINGGSWQNASGTTSWSKSVPLALGSNTIDARAQDDQAHYSSVDSINVTYEPPDDDPPTVQITWPSNGYTTNSSPITVEGTASDDNQVTVVQVRINGGSWQNASGTTSWSKSVSLAPGPNAIDARARDDKPQYSSIDATNVTYNRGPNTPSRPDGPNDREGGDSGTYSTSATDPDGDQVQYRFDWDDGGPPSSWTSFVGSGQSASKSHSWSSKGTYYVKAQARDERGATSGWSVSRRVDVYLYQEVTVVLQPDEFNGKDTYVVSPYPDDNYYSDDFMMCGSWNDGDYVTLVCFNQVGSIPSSATIQSATLSLYCLMQLGTVELVCVHYILEPWESTQVTWNTRPSFSSGSYARTVSDVGWVDWNVTGIVRYWVNEDLANYGFLVKKDGDFGQGYISSTSFYSSECEIPSWRPKLTVTYRYRVP